MMAICHINWWVDPGNLRKSIGPGGRGFLSTDPTSPKPWPPGTVAYHKIRGDAPTTPETPETVPDAVDVEKPKFEAMPHIPHKGGGLIRGNLWTMFFWEWTKNDWSFLYNVGKWVINWPPKTVGPLYLLPPLMNCFREEIGHFINSPLY